MFDFIRKLFGGGTSVDYRALLSKGAIIMDVRTPAEFKSGHIKGAINIPLDQVKSKVPDLQKMASPVITCCRSGNRSSVAKGILSAAGIDCYNGASWNSLNSKIN